MLRITTVGRPDLVFDDDEGGHCATAVLVLVTRRRDRDEVGVGEMNYKNVRAKAGRWGEKGRWHTHGSVVHSAFAVGSESRRKRGDRMSVGGIDLVWTTRGKAERKQKQRNGLVEDEEKHGGHAQDMVAFFIF